MYEPNDNPSLRSVLRAILLIIAAVAVIWVLAWLLFFRDTPSKVGQKNGNPPASPNTRESAPKNGSDRNDTAQPDSGNQGAGQDKNAQSNNSGTPNGSPSTPLANAGPGNVVLPVAIATITGVVSYQVRLRRKVTL
jgi:hypothetical protein